MDVHIYMAYTIRASLFSPPKELIGSITIWCRMDSSVMIFRVVNYPYGDSRENEAQAMFEALTLLRIPHVYEIFAKGRTTK